MTQLPLDHTQLVTILRNSFDVLADEVQSLSDRRTILEHKLRYAHEQYQQLADKYVPGNSEIVNIIAKFQLPLEAAQASDRCANVPLPQRGRNISKQHTAEVIRDGRRASQQIKSMHELSRDATTKCQPMSGSNSHPRSARQTSLSTVLEQDFTIPGRQGSLLCPFASKASMGGSDNAEEDASEYRAPTLVADHSKHGPEDPICAALYRESTDSPAPSVAGSAPKCPIRFLDQHTPEEVAEYFETHKHEIPRSHEICIKRYQKNEQDLRKLDAKYGNLVNMIQGLGQKHQSMLPHQHETDGIDLDLISNERVDTWARDVGGEALNDDLAHTSGQESRTTRCDRELRDIRVGESPTRPWGISVPVGTKVEQTSAHHQSTKPAILPKPQTVVPLPGRTCPFASTTGDARGRKLADHDPVGASQHLKDAPPVESTCPFSSSKSTPRETTQDSANCQPPLPHPTFIPPHHGLQPDPRAAPMVFTGPVFIGYSIDQAIAVLQAYGRNP